MQICKWVVLILIGSLFVEAGSNACSDIYASKIKLTRLVSKSAVKPVFEKSVQKDLDRVIDRTADFDKKIQAMLSPFKRFETEVLFLRQRGSSDSPKYFSLYRNSEVLSDVQFIVTQSLPKDSKLQSNLIRGVEFGYQNLHNEKVQTLGVVPAIELDAYGFVKRVYFHSKEQIEIFRAHFLGRPFSERMRTAILDVNTAIFQHLASNPEAQAKVQAFEKKRGWPRGMAQKLGLVYFSTDVMDLKSFAKSKNFDLEDLVSAGWLKPYVTRNGNFAYRENYDNSIKIPFYDESNPGKIAFWRTRNLDTSDGKPKYLSWPKDRSLYEEAPLFEEFYNSWNLQQAKGKRIVLTEGEFKCAIGEIMTGVFHLGLPGIGQFQSSLLRKIVKAQPSDVVVLFDRDPIGKGLMRIDEVTDSQRASYLIAKQIEAAGIPVKVATLPDVYNGKKIGIDDLLLSHGSKPYVAALDQAMSAEAYARSYGIDTLLTFLTDRKSKIRNALFRFDVANQSVAGVIRLDQRQAYKDLTDYLAMVESTLHFYMQHSYPERRHLNEPSHLFPVIRSSSRLPLKIKTVEGEFETGSAILKITVSPSNVKICTKSSCFSMNKTTTQWSLTPESEKLTSLKSSFEAIFPLDDYSYVQTLDVTQKGPSLLVIRKESRTPVALIEHF